MTAPRTTTRTVVLVGGPRDGEQNVRVPAVAPPGRLAGCCMRPDPQARDGSTRCFSCGADGQHAIERYQLTVDHPDVGLVYRHEPLLPRREPATPS